MGTKQFGFTLLEVTVALTLLAATGVASYSLIHSSLGSIYRVKQKLEMVLVSRNALAYIETINPMEHPAGEMKFGEYLVEWQTEPIAGPVQGSGLYGATSLYELALYDAEVKVFHKKQSVAEMNVRLVGYRQTIPFTLPF